MNPHQPSIALAASIALALSTFTLQASERVVFGGGEFDHVVGSPDVVGAVDTATFSTAPSSLSIGYTDSFQNYVFRSRSKEEMFVPSMVDWKRDTVSFDYMTTSVSALLRIRIFILASGDRQIINLDYNAPLRGLELVADGKWHTMVLKDVDWTPVYRSAVADGFINPDSPYIMRISLQNFVKSGVLYVDNFRIGPKPAEQAETVKAAE